MRTAPKIALSLLISIILFTGLALAAYAGLFNILETRFYQPTVIKSMEGHLEAVSRAMEDWHKDNSARFSAFVGADPVKRSLLPNQSEKDIFDRSNLAGALLADMPGLQGIRIIDAGDTTKTASEDTGKRRIHFSTFETDILSRQDFQIAYDSYGAKDGEIPFSLLSRADGDKPLVITEAAKDRYLYCFPFLDAYSTWRGTAVFYVSARAAAQNLVMKNLFRISDEIALVNSADYKVTGAVTGMPQSGKSILAEAILGRWKKNDFTTDRIVSTDKSGWVLLSNRTGDYGYTGELVQESLFAFPQTVRIFFLVLSFLTLFLVIFLLFNLKQDRIVVLRNRMRRFQVQLLEEVIEKNDDGRWEEIRKNIARRKTDINAELKKGLGRRYNKKHGKEIDALLDKSWDEILAALGHEETRQASPGNTDEIRRMLEQVLQNNAIHLNLTGIGAPAESTGSASRAASGAGKTAARKDQAPVQPAAAASPDSGEVEEADDAEELDEVEEADDAEELDEVEEVADAEELDEVEEADNAEELDEVEEADDAEELDEVEEADDAEELDEVEEADDAEELDEVEEADDAEELDEVEDAADAEELDEVKDADDAEELDEVEDADDAEELDEVKDAADSEDSDTGADEPSLEITDFPEVAVFSFDELKNLDDYNEDNTELLFDDEPVAPAEPDEVDYLEGEWEPALLDVATDEELVQFIEDRVPDEILVYDFNEKPSFDGETDSKPEEFDSAPGDAIPTSSLDFTCLDEPENEEITEVDYIDAFLLGHQNGTGADIRDEPVTGYLEIVGETEPEELADIEAEGDEAGVAAIMNNDGLFVVASNPSQADGAELDPDFKRLVDSVLL